MTHFLKSLRLLSAVLLLSMIPLTGFSEEVASTVNINSASAEQIAEVLKGIGPKKAAEIVAYRDANGGFVSVDELVEIKGIGEATVEKNRAKITLK